MIPRATYRLQFHKGFTFADAEAIVPYLDQLGISHIYASPITTAAPGSTHGYDVIDPTRINPELGGEEAFRSLVKALRSRDMGMIIDIVPNHMGVAGATNPWWNDVLRHGRNSDYAAVFDIDWSRQIVLPVLGSSLTQAIADGAIGLHREKERWWITAYNETRFPIRDDDQDAPDQLPLETLLARQHYRLAYWRTANDELNWRRFFAINELAGVRIEDPEVFERTHALYLRLYAEGLIDGVRVDHVDGLTDPLGYCRTLRERLDGSPRPADAPSGPAWIVIEKILGPDETLSQEWQVDGTSGYDFMEEVTAVLHDSTGAESLSALWHEISGRSPDLQSEELLARQQLLAWQFTGQLEGCVDAFAAIAPEGMTRSMLRRAVERLLWVFPVYRTYGPNAPASDEPVREVVRARVQPHVPPGEAAVVDQILEWLAGGGPGQAAQKAEAVRRFQQLSAPIAAKALEDTAFYRYGRLLSRNDVGFDAGVMALSPAAFHQRMQARAKHWPQAMLTTATHDHKRGEDTRARLAVLSETPARWREAVAEWERIAAPYSNGVDRGDRYMLFQSLLGAWPAASEEDFADRIAAWQSKALREAKLRSSWEAPDEVYERRCNDLARALIDNGRFVGAMNAFLAEIGHAANRNSLIQVALRCTLPGVPDLYQGNELADLSLVDPDNRRPVDYAARSAALSAPPPKLRLLYDLLQARRSHTALFASGSYEPAIIEGDGSDRLLAFERRHGERILRCAVTLHGAAQPGTAVLFPSGVRYSAESLLEQSPVWYEIT
ncbi:malto-oligosyltrehalose synthase [Sphingomonas mucosissima]|uniref:Maltooligosyl trehalose synthase n=1 Tax=Sphingomonas mucosissima TaxID=370959 RepID=A0A245ZTI2_9SPHN|nr:malto-oligosyltrehalose synthase [Sphingomonas mucosissima]OWK33058.1 maltooligosyl trehalose synthase [Sphingomonas mucosissima]